MQSVSGVNIFRCVHTFPAGIQGRSVMEVLALLYLKKKLDDGWPESVEEQGLLLLVWRCNFRNGI